jgi:hypothetical protein
LLLTACPGRVMNAAARNVAEGLSKAILNQSDVVTIRDGLPGYLISVDGLINSSPENIDLLSAGARLYSMYASNFVDDPVRARIMTDRARDYGHRVLCLQSDNICDNLSGDFDAFVKAVKKSKAEDVPALYAYASAEATWIQAHSEDWNAVAELPRVKAVMEKIVDLNEGYDHGNAHLYLGVITTQLPKDLGGKPEEAREHFDRAVELSEGRNLIAKVIYARQYARLVFDRALHDRLVQEVLDAPAEVDGLTLSNTIAKDQALKLKQTANDFF